MVLGTQVLSDEVVEREGLRAVWHEGGGEEGWDEGSRHSR